MPMALAPPAAAPVTSAAFEPRRPLFASPIRMEIQRLQFNDRNKSQHFSIMASYERKRTFVAVISSEARLTSALPASIVALSALAQVVALEVGRAHIGRAAVRVLLLSASRMQFPAIIARAVETY